MLHLRVYNELLAPSGVQLSKTEYCEKYLGFDDEGVFEQLAQDQQIMLGDEEIEVLISEKARRFEALVAAGGGLYPPAAAPVRRGGGGTPGGRSGSAGARAAGRSS